MNSAQRSICLVLVSTLFLFLLPGLVYAEEANIWEMAYPYCESELGYTRDDLTPNQYAHNEDGSWSFSLYVKDAEPMTNGLVIGSLDPTGRLLEIKGPEPVSTAEWLNQQVRKCMFNYQEIYKLKQQWEPKLDSIPEKDMAILNGIQSFNPILDFLRLDIVLPDEKCIPYEEATRRAIAIIEGIDGWKPEMTEHIDIMAEVVYIPSGMEHPVYHFIYSVAGDVLHEKTVLYGKEYSDELLNRINRMWDEEEAVFGGNSNLPIHISIRIDAYTGEQVGKTFLETPPVSGIGYTGIILWK